MTQDSVTWIATSQRKPRLRRLVWTHQVASGPKYGPWRTWPPPTTLRPLTSPRFLSPLPLPARGPARLGWGQGVLPVWTTPLNLCRHFLPACSLGEEALFTEAPPPAQEHLAWTWTWIWTITTKYLPWLPRCSLTRCPACLLAWVPRQVVIHRFRRYTLTQSSLSIDNGNIKYVPSPERVLSCDRQPMPFFPVQLRHDVCVRICRKNPHIINSPVWNKAPRDKNLLDKYISNLNTPSSAFERTLVCFISRSYLSGDVLDGSEELGVVLRRLGSFRTASAYFVIFFFLCWEEFVDHSLKNRCWSVIHERQWRLEENNTSKQ